MALAPGIGAWLKRALDIVGAAGVLVLLGPYMMFITLLIRIKLGRPVLFRQTRPGKKGHPFTLLKFRSMSDTRGVDGALAPDQDRLTPFGLWLRATSSDELPALFNVLRGEMSLVGPRPLLMEYLDRYTPEQARRHEIRPGITGWAQIKGRNALIWEEKFRLDIWYVDNRSLWLDLKILAITMARVLRRDGISADGHVTMPEFRGRRFGSISGEERL